jgi:CDP-diacylglycerol pyrophosphatase
MPADWKTTCLFAFAGFTLLTLVADVAAGANRNALWTIIHDQCVPHQEAANDPAPCAEVDLSRGEADGWVILKDREGDTHFLTIPTRQAAGIEDPLIGTPGQPDYWRAAWSARQRVSARTGKALPRDTVGMAINGHGWRSQDQLHIHTDCIRPAVRETLAGHEDEIGEQWNDFPYDLAGQRYRVRRLTGAEPEPDPFALLRADAKAQGGSIAERTLAVLGDSAQGRDGFILLTRQSVAGDRAHAEDLLDRDCAIARSLP